MPDSKEKILKTINRAQAGDIPKQTFRSVRYGTHSFECRSSNH